MPQRNKLDVVRNTQSLIYIKESPYLSYLFNFNGLGYVLTTDCICDKIHYTDCLWNLYQQI